MYRVMSADNGMSILMTRIGIAGSPAIERSSLHPVYDVIDPAIVRCRVGLQTSRPVYMMTLSRKRNAAALFKAPVLQSDYSIQWSDTSPKPKKSRRAEIFDRLPATWQNLITEWKGRRRFSLSNSKFYRRLW
jgi:hypothetical protein